MDYQEISKLKEGEVGERVNLKAGWEWVLTKMPYEEFEALTTLDFGGAAPAHYRYCINEKDDTRKTREDYIKYALYKLIQNLNTSGMHLTKGGGW